jgi:hypothetical protein
MKSGEGGVLNEDSCKIKERKERVEQTLEPCGDRRDLSRLI